MTKLPEITRDVSAEMLETNMMDALALGMYQRLLWQAWGETPPCSLPDDDTYLALVARVSVSEFMERKHAVMSPFTLGADKRWHHPRMKVIFDKARERAKAYQSNARRRWEERKDEKSLSVSGSNRNATALQGESNGIKTAEQGVCNSTLSIDLERGDRGSVRGEESAMQRHPAGISHNERVGIWEGVFGECLPIYKQEKLATLQITDAGIWQEALEAWAMNGYSPKNFAGQYDYYRKRQLNANKEVAQSQKAKVINMPINQTVGVCTTCWGDGTVVTFHQDGKPKGRIECPKCAAKTKTA